jgi:hypothetical protein
VLRVGLTVASIGGVARTVSIAIVARLFRFVQSLGDLGHTVKWLGLEVRPGHVCGIDVSVVSRSIGAPQ